MMPSSAGSHQIPKIINGVSPFNNPANKKQAKTP